MVVFYLIIILLFLILVYYIYPIIRPGFISNTKGLNAFKVLKNANRFSVAAGEFMEQANIRKGFYHYWLGHRFAMAACDPDSAEFVLKCPQIEKFKPFSSNMVNQNFGDNLVFTNGEHWRKQRILVNPGFNTVAYQNYYPIFQESAEKVLEKWDAIMGNDIDCRSWFSKFTIDLLGKSIFHCDFQNLDSKENELFNAYKSLLIDENTLSLIFFPFLEYIPIPSTKQRQKNVNIILSHFKRIIEDHKNQKDKNSQNKDILDNLLENHHQLSHHELICNLFVFFLAGHHTTTSALATAVCELADKPHIQERLYEEIISKYGTNSPSFESISSETTCEYLQNFLLENLRLHPPVDVIPTRMSKADIPYQQQIIPKNSYVVIDARNIHRHPQYWENPGQFDPDRFLPERKKGRHKYAFLPFSLGKRQCLGTEFSFIEQRLFLVRLLQRYTVLPPKDHAPRILSESGPPGSAELDKFWIRIEKR